MPTHPRPASYTMIMRMHVPARYCHHAHQRHMPAYPPTMPPAPAVAPARRVTPLPTYPLPTHHPSEPPPPPPSCLPTKCRHNLFHFEVCPKFWHYFTMQRSAGAGHPHTHLHAPPGWLAMDLPMTVPVCTAGPRVCTPPYVS